MKFRATTKTFIAPWIYLDGEELPNMPADFIPGPHLEPLDEEAKQARARYEAEFEKRYGGVPSLQPVENLPRTITDPVEERKKAEAALRAEAELRAKIEAEVRAKIADEAKGDKK